MRYEEYRVKSFFITSILALKMEQSCIQPCFGRPFICTPVGRGSNDLGRGMLKYKLPNP